MKLLKKTKECLNEESRKTTEADGTKQASELSRKRRIMTPVVFAHPWSTREDRTIFSNGLARGPARWTRVNVSCRVDRNFCARQTREASQDQLYQVARLSLPITLL